MAQNISIDAVDDWALVVAICSYSSRPNIDKDILNQAYRAAWACTDAYGEVGMIPVQGYDWSGFRDSSDESTKRSAEAIRKVLNKYGIKEVVVENGIKEFIC